MTNSQSATHKIRLVKCSPHPPGSSQSNFLKYSQEHGYVFRISPSTSPKRTPKHSISVSGKHRFSEIGITPTATNTITPTATTTNSPTTIPALVNIYTSLPPRSRMPSSHTSSITIPLSPSIPPRYHFPPDVAGTPTIRTLGGVLTIPALAKRSHHRSATLIHHHHNNEYNINTFNKRIIFTATHAHRKSISFPHTNRSGIQYHQLYRISFFIIQFFSNPFK